MQGCRELHEGLEVQEGEQQAPASQAGEDPVLQGVVHSSSRLLPGVACSSQASATVAFAFFQPALFRAQHSKGFHLNFGGGAITS